MEFLKKYKKIILILFISSLTLGFFYTKLGFRVYHYFFTQPYGGDFNQQLRVKMAGLDDHIKVFKKEKKHYPFNTKEIMLFLMEYRGGSGSEYRHWKEDKQGNRELNIFDLSFPPDNDDEYFKTDINIADKLMYSGLYLNSKDELLKTYIELKPMHLGYYVNKDLTSYAIYGVDKENKIYRDKRYKNTDYYNRIFYYSNN